MRRRRIGEGLDFERFFSHEHNINSRLLCSDDSKFIVNSDEEEEVESSSEEEEEGEEEEELVQSNSDGDEEEVRASESLNDGLKKSSLGILASFAGSSIHDDSVTNSGAIPNAVNTPTCDSLCSLQTPIKKGRKSKKKKPFPDSDDDSSSDGIPTPPLKKSRTMHDSDDDTVDDVGANAVDTSIVEVMEDVKSPGSGYVDLTDDTPEPKKKNQLRARVDIDLTASGESKENANNSSTSFFFGRGGHYKHKKKKKEILSEKEVRAVQVAKNK